MTASNTEAMGETSRERLDDLAGIATQLDIKRLDEAAYLTEFRKSRYVFQKSFSGGAAVVSASGYTTADYPPVPGARACLSAT